ncbi:MAG: flagellar biosynthesis protein FliQ [Alphaproteobacteria bacterium]|nr:flagellar biosynthesis protein FliQ [Alphaproteobacteria bacterium]
MNELVILSLARESMIVALKISAPALAAALIVGLVLSMLQAITQISEMTLTFVPKLLGMLAVMLLTGPFVGGELVDFGRRTFAMLAEYRDIADAARF